MILKSLAFVSLICMSLLYFSCGGHARSTIPSEFTGTWQRLHSDDITEQADMTIIVQIIQDTVMFNQTVTGMDGLQKISSRYIFNRITAENDSTILLNINDPAKPAIITLRMGNHEHLKISYCMSNENSDSEVAFTGCNEWGTFEKVPERTN